MSTIIMKKNKLEVELSVEERAMLFEALNAFKNANEKMGLLTGIVLGASGIGVDIGDRAKTADELREKGSEQDKENAPILEKLIAKLTLGFSD